MLAEMPLDELRDGGDQSVRGGEEGGWRRVKLRVTYPFATSTSAGIFLGKWRGFPKSGNILASGAIRRIIRRRKTRSSQKYLRLAHALRPLPATNLQLIHYEPILYSIGSRD